MNASAVHPLHPSRATGTRPFAAATSLPALWTAGRRAGSPF